MVSAGDQWTAKMTYSMKNRQKRMAYGGKKHERNVTSMAALWKMK